MKKDISILWVDDRRDPLVYLKKKEEPGKETLSTNLNFYKDLLKKYNPNFTWVKSFEEFKNHIIKNGIPDFVSFDRDLGKGLPNGENCAEWLVQYCGENGFNLPKFYAHTANRPGKIRINNIMNGNDKQKIQITSDDIKEAVQRALSMIMEGHSVYIDKNKIDTDKKTVSLTYNNGGTQNTGAVAGDNLNTDKMDSDGGNDVYEVKLKNGLVCYNITSINGTEVMHYFKRKWDNKDTNIKVDGEDYKLSMKRREEDEFLARFKRKVAIVINYYKNELEKKNEGIDFTKISIYPVPSTSNFNKVMAEKLVSQIIGGYQVQVINPDILVKDLRNLEKDNEFIEKNKKFYHDDYAKGEGKNKPSVEDMIDLFIKKNGAKNAIPKLVDELNKTVDIIRGTWNRMRRSGSIDFAEEAKTLKTIKKQYAKYCEIISNIWSIYDEEGKTKRTRLNKLIEPADEGTNAAGFNLMKTITNYLLPLMAKSGLLSKKTITRMYNYKENFELKKWKPVPFEIKNISNGVRMGVKNIYNPNDVDPEKAEMIKQELEKIKGTLFVIFDDNVSGGATLSDVCYQCTKMGIKNIVPITFGVMNEKWTIGRLCLNKPTNDKTGKEGFNF